MYSQKYFTEPPGLCGAQFQHPYANSKPFLELETCMFNSLLDVLQNQES